MDPVPSFRQELPRWITLYLPLFVLVYPVLLLIPGLNWEEGLYREYGFIENLTAVLLLASSILLLRAAFVTRDLVQRSWLVLISLGAFVFFGEEISWGQHYFHWTTPDEWKAVNRQRETNLHNIKGGTEYLFTKIVRPGLATAVFVSGLLVPWFLRLRKVTFVPGQIQFWLWPSIQCSLTALLSTAVRLPVAIARPFGMEDKLPRFIGDDISETKEAYFALFILLYAITQLRVLARTRNERASET